VVVGLLAGLGCLRMILVTGEPLLHIGHVTGLEVVPLLQAGRLDPFRPEPGADRQIGEPGQVVVVRGADARPHGGDLGRGRRVLPEAFAEQHPASRVDQPAQRVQRVDGALRQLGVAERVGGADAQD